MDVHASCRIAISLAPRSDREAQRATAPHERGIATSTQQAEIIAVDVPHTCRGGDGTVEHRDPTLLLWRELGALLSEVCDAQLMTPLTLEDCARELARDASFRDAFWNAMTHKVRAVHERLLAQLPARPIAVQ